jgi:hypothetical protein
LFLCEGPLVLIRHFGPEAGSSVFGMLLGLKLIKNLIYVLG